jgi:hypothetical protein
MQSFARRRPAVFLALAAGAGLVAGRLTRGLKDASGDSPASTPAPGSPSAQGPSEQWAQPDGRAGYPRGSEAGVSDDTLGLPAPLPASSAEERAAAKVKDAAAPAVTSAARDAAASLQDSAQQAAESVKATAADAATTVKDEAAVSAQDVREEAHAARDTVSGRSQ